MNISTNPEAFTTIQIDGKVLHVIVANEIDYLLEKYSHVLADDGATNTKKYYNRFIGDKDAKALDFVFIIMCMLPTFDGVLVKNVDIPLQEVFYGGTTYCVFDGILNVKPTSENASLYVTDKDSISSVDCYVDLETLRPFWTIKYKMRSTDISYDGVVLFNRVRERQFVYSEKFYRDIHVLDYRLYRRGCGELYYVLKDDRDIEPPEQPKKPVDTSCCTIC